MGLTSFAGAVLFCVIIADIQWQVLNLPFNILNLLTLNLKLQVNERSLYAGI